MKAEIIGRVIVVDVRRQSSQPGETNMNYHSQTMQHTLLLMSKEDYEDLLKFDYSI